MKGFNFIVGSYKCKGLFLSLNVIGVLYVFMMLFLTRQESNYISLAMANVTSQLNYFYKDVTPEGSKAIDLINNLQGSFYSPNLCHTGESNTTICSKVNVDINIQKRPWQMIEYERNHEIWLFSSFLHQKGDQLVSRTFAMTKTTEDVNLTSAKEGLLCKYWYINEDSVTFKDVPLKEVQYIPVFGPKFKTWLFSFFDCDLPNTESTPDVLSVTSMLGNSVQENALVINKPTEKVFKADKLRLAMCVSALLFVDNGIPRRLIEWIEMQKLIGFEKIIVYILYVEPGMLKVLKHYESLGYVSLAYFSYPSEFPTKPKELQDYIYNTREGFRNYLSFEKLAENDCLYKNKHHFDYIGVMDLDETTVIREAISVPEFIQSMETEHPSLSALSFERYIFPPDKKSNLSSEDSTTYMIDHVKREPRLGREDLQLKSIYRTRKLGFTMGHEIVLCDGHCNSLPVSAKIGYIAHFRSSCSGKCSKRLKPKQLLKDLTLQRNAQNLSSRTQEVLQFLSL